MTPFRSLAAALALLTALLSLPAQANPNGDPIYNADAPPAYAMIGDLLIARPLLIAGTVIGTGVFIVTLPFSLLGGNVGEAGQALVVEPAKAAFVRCLGCTESGYKRN
ncbi:MAG TPA: multidrug transporter [Pseudomonas sp.]|jgi:hypothetical protein|nr:multidrug transporter [Pseudomonas sp.]